MIRIFIGLLAALAFANPALADDLAAALALPVASELTGAQNVGRFAWVANEAGVRNIWLADKGGAARRITAFAQDDGIELYDLALARDGSALAYTRGGDGEFPDDRIPNAGHQPIAPEQSVFLDALDGTPAVQIGQGHAAVFAPAGGAIAFVRGHELWLWRKGGKAERIASVPGAIGRL